MKKLLMAAGSLLPILIANSASAQSMAGLNRGQGKIANSWICVFNDDAVAANRVADEARGAVQAHGGQIKHVYDNALRGFAASIPDQAVEHMKAANKSIAYCEQDQVATIASNGRPKNVSISAVQPAQSTPWGIAKVGGGVAGTFKRAWIIDTGIDLTHPDLNVDTTRSRSFATGYSSAQDQNGHGTHVAGTIAARNNTIGVIGVAPGASVVAVRALDPNGSGSYSDIIAAVNYVSANAAAGDVANMSLGGPVSSSLDTAVKNAAAKGIYFALAAGNESQNANNVSPARANGTYIWTVSAFDSANRFAYFSNYANPPIDVSEPGVGILSTWLGGGYATLDGTSMATPHLAGLILQRSVRSGGTVIGDPDGNPDTIGVR